MEQKAGAQISQRAFIQSLAILMMAAGILTRVVPAGQYARVQAEGREVIAPNSFHLIPRPDYPVWRWFTAPIEVLGAEGNLTIIVIIIFLLFIGGAFAVLEKSGIVKAVLGRIVQRFGEQKYTLLLVVSLAFMLMGASFGIFEEVIPLVPVMIALSYSLGWDVLVGLGFVLFNLYITLRQNLPSAFKHPMKSPTRFWPSLCRLALMLDRAIERVWGITDVFQHQPWFPTFVIY